MEDRTYPRTVEDGDGYRRIVFAAGDPGDLERVECCGRLVEAIDVHEHERVTYCRDCDIYCKS